MLNKISEITIGATTLINVLIVFWIKTLMIKDLFCTKVLFFQLMIEKITKSNQYLKKVKVKKPNLAERRSKKKMKIISIISILKNVKLAAPLILGIVIRPKVIVVMKKSSLKAKTSIFSSFINKNSWKENFRSSSVVCIFSRALNKA